uniref:TSA: Wollemia nobilis Ref_Wollemi_Transcript_22244_1015 transcribed RNA sequence n=1 Tax=Wollemia nobilis TaxID=56998 RepID=A0A0C9QMG6_9CONI
MAGRMGMASGRTICRVLTCFMAPASSSQYRFVTSNLMSSHSDSATMKCRLPISLGTPVRAFSSDISALPPIKDPDVRNALKDVLASDWGELYDSVKADVMDALSKETDDKAGQEALANAWRAAEAVEHFSGVLESLRMELDEINGPTGENVRPLPDELKDALQAVYQRYRNYLDAFGPDETYLKKKVENELGTRMIHIKMRCSGLDSEWGKVTLLGTSGISGSYIEQRS